MVNIIIYILISELGGFAFLAATNGRLKGAMQIAIWGFFVSPIIAVVLMGSPLGFIVWAAHRALGFALYFKYFHRR